MCLTSWYCIGRFFGLFGRLQGSVLFYVGEECVMFVCLNSVPFFINIFLEGKEKYEG